MADRATLTARPARNPSNRPTWTTRERLEKNLTSMKSVRHQHESEIYEIASLAQPNRSRAVAAMGPNSRKAKRANKLYDGHAIRSFRYLAGGMYSGMSSPNRPWSAFALADRDLMEYQPVKEWLADSGKVISQMLVTSNFYAGAKVNYGEVGLFATAVGIMDEGFDRETGDLYPVTTPKTFGEYWISCNSKGEPERLMVRQFLTVEQIVADYVADRLDPRNLDWSRVSQPVMNAWDQGNYNNEIPMIHAIEPNREFVPGRLDQAGKAWCSYKWEEAQSDKGNLLEEAGYHSQPFWAPRWEVAASDVYGFGPGHDALADMRTLQLQAKRKGEATDYVVKPPMMAPSSVKIKWQSGSVTYAAAADQAQVKELFKVPYQAVEVIAKDQYELRDAIDDATYARLFMAISNLEGSADRTVAEIAAREEEKLTQLGPVIERVNNEMLAVALDRAFDIAARDGRLAEPPPELGGMPIEIEFTSILAQAQKMIGMQQTERALGFVANVEAVAPGRGAMDNVDVDGLIGDYWERSGASPSALMDPRERDEMRASREQAARAKQAAEQAPALQAGAEGVKALAETRVAGGTKTLFDSLIGAT